MLGFITERVWKMIRYFLDNTKQTPTPPSKSGQIEFLVTKDAQGSET